MGGDAIACRFLRVGGTMRCSLRQDPMTMRYREVLCAGLPGRCEVPELRERELRRRAAAERANEMPASIWCRLARRAGW